MSARTEREFLRNIYETGINVLMEGENKEVDLSFRWNVMLTMVISNTGVSLCGIRRKRERIVDDYAEFKELWNFIRDIQ